ncbi:MAG: hypothetical protein JRH06_01750 [Deltaproteobacteria bacterium]|nr:hypothetical protein [Deltaproteobacteria bacterium]MBW2136266.1 hypothetical protein [Deltaproteobacteria bacterium]
MKKKDNRAWWWIGLFIVAALATVVGYFLGLQRAHKEAEPPVISVPEETPREPRPEEDATAKQEELPAVVEPEVNQRDSEPPELFKDCKEARDEILEFFRYLDGQVYVKRLNSNTNTYDTFKELIGTLSANPPVPAGEGIDTRLITKNIFHFFRILDRKDLRLIRQVIEKEKDSLEINMALFYVWLAGRGSSPCTDREAIRPSFDTLYRYAGFFLNTIGGRAYLFRRATKFRLLVSFYSLLIIHEADKQGTNTLGIDIFPLLEPLGDEISLYPDLYFKDQYLEKLDEISRYYLLRR